MSYFFISFILLILGLVLSIISIVLESKGPRAALIITAVIAFVSALGTFAAMEIPKPEIYTTNGNSLVDNEVYIKTEWPLSVRYSLAPYGDPQEDGARYEDKISIEGTMTVSAKATFLGIKWSALESKDIIVGSNGDVDIIETEKPGTSIREISSYLVNSRFFPGDVLKKEDIRVEGITINGESVTLEDFSYSPDTFSEGENTITICYKNLSDEIKYTAVMPKLISIEAQYLGEDLREGDTIEPEMFEAVGVYENGQRIPLENFTVNPSAAEQTGELMINIGAEEVSAAVVVLVKEREYAFSAINELHEPNGPYDPKVYASRWEEGTDYSVDGKTFEDGLKLTFDNWMSGLMGNGTDFAENVESNFYFAVNQDVLSQLPEEDRCLNGHFVVARDTNGSPTTASISIYADGEEVYQSGEILSTSTQIPPFQIPAEGVEQIIIQTKARVCGNKFIIGIIFD